jgi:hypothetical protein
MVKRCSVTANNHMSLHMIKDLQDFVRFGSFHFIVFFKQSKMTVILDNLYETQTADYLTIIAATYSGNIFE